MLTEKDKNNLYKGKKCLLFTFFRKKKALKDLNALIKDADDILNNYKEVEFSNVYETEINQGGHILMAEQKWNIAVETFLCNIFNDNYSDLQTRLNIASFASDAAISNYAKSRYRIVEKQKILIAFRDELEKL